MYSLDLPVAAFTANFLISKLAVSVFFTKVSNACTFLLQKYDVAGSQDVLLVLLRVLFRGTEEFKNLLFQLAFCDAVVIGAGIFQF